MAAAEMKKNKCAVRHLTKTKAYKILNLPDSDYEAVKFKEKTHPSQQFQK